MAERAGFPHLSVLHMENKAANTTVLQLRSDTAPDPGEFECLTWASPSKGRECQGGL